MLLENLSGSERRLDRCLACVVTSGEAETEGVTIGVTRGGAEEAVAVAVAVVAAAAADSKRAYRRVISPCW